MNRYAVMIAVVTMWGAGVANATTTIDVLLGDVDGLIYNGVGSVDDVYVDPAWLAAVAPGSGPENPFDVLTINHNVPFTFVFPLSPGQRVIAATLDVAIQGGGDFVNTDVIFFEVKVDLRK